MTYPMKTLMLFAVAAVMSAQNPPPPPGPGLSFDAVREYLSLSHSQSAQLKQLMRSRVESNRARIQEINQKRRQLDEMVRQGSVDAAALGRLMLEVEGYRKQLRGADDGFLKDAAALLDASQRSKLADLEDAARLIPAVHDARALGLLRGPDGASNAPLPLRRPAPTTRARQ